MPEIRLNCLVVPSDSVGRITQLTIKINNNEFVHSPRSQIKKNIYTPRFDNIPITEFVVRAIPLNSDKVLASVNAEGVMISVNIGRQDEVQALFPMLNILDHFPKQPSEKDIHIIIYLDIKTPQ
uniref:Crinkler effector protein N-terminal domain-containing protein n=1 Tax=Rhizophagus irregularis (strain DAOM 181602 / DAOM 197198 / MUCL 43194) TaxID=747089 RepID=U9SS41_RHIID